MKISIALLAIFILFASTPALAVEYLFLEHSISGWNLNVTNGQPNHTYDYVMTQPSGTGSIKYSLNEAGPWNIPQNISVTTNSSGIGATLFFVKGFGLGTANWQVCLQSGGSCNNSLNFEVVTISTLEFQEINS